MAGVSERLRGGARRLGALPSSKYSLLPEELIRGFCATSVFGSLCGSHGYLLIDLSSN